MHRGGLEFLELPQNRPVALSPSTAPTLVFALAIPFLLSK